MLVFFYCQEISDPRKNVFFCQIVHHFNENIRYILNSMIQCKRVVKNMISKSKEKIIEQDKIEIKNSSNLLDMNKTKRKKLFLHYTNIKNLNSIMEKGLEPRIGKNSTVIEKNKKVFFTIGEIGALVIMDVWLKWLIKRPRNNFIYKCGAYFITKPYFPKFIFDIIWKIWHKSKRKFAHACDDLYDILNNSVFLILELEENIDFSFDDIDEAKSQKIPKRHLKSIYSYEGSLKDNKIEYWNMHTFRNKLIEKEKISVLTLKDTYNANEIIEYLSIRHKNYVEDNLHYLKRYLTYLKKRKA